VLSWPCLYKSWFSGVDSLFKSKEFRFWFTLFTVQLIFACVVPTAVLFCIPVGDAPLDIDAEGFLLKGVAPEEAKNTLSGYYQSISESGAVVLEACGRQMRIPYDTFEVQADFSNIFKEIDSKRFTNMYYQLIEKNRVLIKTSHPEIYINEAKLREILGERKALFHVPEVNAELTLEQGTLTVTPHSDGLEFDVDKAAEYIKGRFEMLFSPDIVVSEGSAPEVYRVVEPEITSEILKDYSYVYSTISGELSDGETENFKKLLDGFRNKIISPGEVFSYNESFPAGNAQAGLNALLASSIYRAVLPVADIKVTWRKPAFQPVPGIEPGFEVNLDGDGDLRFQNTSNVGLAIVSDVDESGKWTLILAGKPGLTVGEIKTTHTKILPPVIYVQDSTLPEKVQKVKEPGKEGLSVKVRRIAGDSIYEYEDIYQPVYRIISVGTGVKKEEIIVK